VLATLAVGTAAALVAAGIVTAGNRGRTVAGTGLLRTGAHLSSGSGQTRASLLIVSTSEASAAARLPGRSLVYFSGTDVNTRWSTGVPYSQAKANGWLLKNAAGKLLVNRSHPDDYVGNVGSAAYQRAWIRNVSGFLKAHGDDGIMIDDVLADLVPLAGAEAAAYPTQQAWPPRNSPSSRLSDLHCAPAATTSWPAPLATSQGIPATTRAQPQPRGGASSIRT